MRLLADLRYAARTLAKSPSFALIAVLSLALGIGANTAMFSYVDAILLRPLPVPDSGRIVEVDSTAPNTRLGRMSYPDYADLRDRTRTLESLVSYDFFFAGISTQPNEVPKYSLDVIASGNFFSGLGIDTVAGRSFRPEEDSVPGRDLVAVISHGLWQQEYALDPNVVGRKIRINGVDFTIVGIAPESFQGPQAFLAPQVYVPMNSFTQALPGQSNDYLTNRNSRSLNLLGRLKPGVSASQAQAELATIARQLATQYPASNKDRSVRALGWVNARFENDPIDAQLALMLLSITALVLLIACANVANLLIARGTARAKEIAIRMAIGARRGILVRQFLTESLLIALLGGAAGIGVGVAGIRFLQSIPLPADFPLDLGLQIDGRLLAFTLLSAVATALIFGLLPALRATRSDLATTIKASDAGPARISLFRGIFSGRNILVTAQLALSVILLGVSVLCVRGFQIARNLDPGFRMDHTLFFSMNPNIQRFDEAKTRDFYKKLTDRLRAAGGVEEVSISSTIPFNAGPGSRNVMLDGVKQRAGEDTPTAWSNAVGEHYFDLMQTRILRGRAINAFDTATSPKVAVINETLANKFFPGQDPIGKQLRLDKPDGPLVQIVGVAKNGLYFYWAEPAQNAIFTPFSQDYNSQMDVEMRTSGDPASFAAAVRENVRALDPDMPIFRISTMTRFFDDRAMLGPRLIAQIVTATGFMGLIMAIVGLYGVVAYSVSRRTREIGIRMAIGATPRGIVRMVLTQGIALTVVGLALGIGLILLSKSALAFFIIGVSPYSPEVLVGVPVILALAMMIACFVPARRAASIDPTRALRLE